MGGMSKRLWILVMVVAAAAGLMVVKGRRRGHDSSPPEWRSVEPLGESVPPDPVDEAIAESFPASDPPSFNPGV